MVWLRALRSLIMRAVHIRLHRNLHADDKHAERIAGSQMACAVQVTGVMVLHIAPCILPLCSNMCERVYAGLVKQCCARLLVRFQWRLFSGCSSCSALHEPY